MKEQHEAMNLQDPNIYLFNHESDLLVWFAYLCGPEDSPFRDGIFKVRL